MKPISCTCPNKRVLHDCCLKKHTSPNHPPKTPVKTHLHPWSPDSHQFVGNPLYTIGYCKLMVDMDLGHTHSVIAPQTNLTSTSAQPMRTEKTPEGGQRYDSQAEERDATSPRVSALILERHWEKNEPHRTGGGGGGSETWNGVGASILKTQSTPLASGGQTEGVVGDLEGRARIKDTANVLEEGKDCRNDLKNTTFR